MPNQINQRIFNKIITLENDSIIFSNKKRASLVAFRRFLVLKFFNKSSEEITVSFERDNYPTSNKLIINRESKMFISERITGEIIDFNFNDFQNFLADNLHNSHFLLIDKRTKHFANAELSNTFQKVSPKVVVCDSETSTQECNITVDQNDHYINSLKILLQKLNNSDFLSALNSALALPQWCSDNKFSSIYKEELKRRQTSSSGKS